MHRFIDTFYIVNVLVLLTYIPVRYYMLEDKNLVREEEWFGATREQQIYFLLALSCLMKYRSCNTVDAFLATCFRFGKVSILVATMVSDKRICAWYALIFLIMVIAVRQKDYEGATLVRDMSAGLFERLIENDDSNTQWLVEFYTSWADDCVHFTSLFAILSLKYTSPGLKLARVNVGLAHNERIADKYKINITTRSTQLPTLVLFQHGRPIPEHQLPPVDKKSGKVTKCIMNQRIVTEFFELKERTKLEYKSKTSKTAHQMKAKKQK